MGKNDGESSKAGSGYKGPIYTQQDLVNEILKLYKQIENAEA